MAIASGDRFGRLLILDTPRRAVRRSSSSRSDYYYEALCDCGNQIWIKEQYLQAGKASCGCRAKGRPAEPEPDLPEDAAPLPSIGSWPMNG